jgi:hypothetical protein
MNPCIVKTESNDKAASDEQLPQNTTTESTTQQTKKTSVKATDKGWGIAFLKPRYDCIYFRPFSDFDSLEYSISKDDSYYAARSAA